jgi:hypothetical protein
MRFILRKRVETPPCIPHMAHIRACGPARWPNGEEDYNSCACGCDAYGSWCYTEDMKAVVLPGVSWWLRRDR